MSELFLIKPFLALILISLTCSLFGVFVLWNRLTSFGDNLSHSILLGLALGACLSLNQTLTLIFFAIIFALLVFLIMENNLFSKNTLIASISYFCIAAAVLINDIWIKNFDFSSYIFGDILTVGNDEIFFLSAIATLAIFFTFFSFRKMLLINVSRDLARIEGIKIELWNFLFLISLSLAIALSVRIVGIFLMTALLILPAAIARIFSSSAKQMLLISSIVGICSSVTSFKIATNYDLTVSSTIVMTLAIVFILGLIIKNQKFPQKN